MQTSSKVIDLTYNRSYKVIIIGDAQVGKTTFLSKLDDSKNKIKLGIYSPTVAVDVKIKYFKYKNKHNGSDLIDRLVIWEKSPSPAKK